MGALVKGPVPPVRATPKDSPPGKVLEKLPARGPEKLLLAVANGDLRSGGAQMRSHHIRIRGVKHGGLDVGFEDHLGVTHNVRVEGILARNKHCKRLA